MANQNRLSFYKYCLGPLLYSLNLCMLMQNPINVNYVHCILNNNVSLFTLEIKTNKWIKSSYLFHTHIEVACL